jgi:fucose 4-O-acetylase-like acetyltransferase
MRPAGADRAPVLDNARFILMLLVVVGHALEPLQGKYGFVKSVYFFIYLFHMYAFTLISGYLSRPTVDRAAATRQLARLLAPYLVFELLYGVLLHLLHGTLELSFAITSPYKHLWFLISLLTWRLLLPWITAIRFSVIVAAAAALLAGFSNDIGVPLSLSRSLVFLPVFLVGYRLQPHHLERLGRIDARLVATVVLLGAATAAAVWAPDLRYDFIFGKHSYAALGWDSVIGAGLRALQLAVTLVCTLAFLSLVPRRRLWISGLGQRTLYSYLLHQAAILVAITLGLYAWLPNAMPGWAALLLLIAGSAALHLLLSSRPVAWLARPLVEPAPRHLSLVLAVVGLLLVGSLGLRSLNHAGARFAASADLPAAAPPGLSCDDDGCLPVNAGGLVLQLERLRRSARVEIGLTPGDYEVSFFRRNLRMGISRVQVSGEPSTAGQARAQRVRVPRRAARRGYDAVLVRPEGEHTAGWLAFLGR